MATYQTRSTKGTPITVIYPAERPSANSANVRFRVGKKTVRPAYAAANLPHLVQFQIGQRIVMFMLSDVLQSSYWQKVRNAYTWFGQLDIDADVRVDSPEIERIIQWLSAESADRGIVLDSDHAFEPVGDCVSG
jgi:hypothetical protein